MSPLEFHLRAERFEDLPHEPHVAQVGHAADDARFGGQQRRRHDGQRGVLAAADGHLAVQRHAAFDQKTFHVKLIYPLVSSSSSCFDCDYEDDDEDDLAIKILSR